MKYIGIKFIPKEYTVNDISGNIKHQNLYFKLLIALINMQENIELNVK